MKYSKKITLLSGLFLLAVTLMLPMLQVKAASLIFYENKSKVLPWDHGYNDNANAGVFYQTVRVYNGAGTSSDPDKVTVDGYLRLYDNPDTKNYWNRGSISINIDNDQGSLSDKWKVSSISISALNEWAYDDFRSSTEIVSGGKVASILLYDYNQYQDPYNDSGTRNHNLPV